MLKSLMLALGVAAAVLPTAARAEYPEQPIKMIVPFAPGGTTDALARLVATQMSEALGKNVLVENVGGAGGRIGTTQVARSTADGYTILFANSGPMAATLPVFNEQDYDPRTDLAPVGIVADVPMVLAASKASGITALAAFVEKLKADGDAVNIGTAGVGATSDLAPTLFLNQMGLTATKVPYQGVGPAIVDLTAGTMDAVFDQTVTMVPLRAGQQASLLAVTGNIRLPQMPEVPTFAEAGYPKFDMKVWNAIAAPKGTPPDVVAKLSAALDKALDSDFVKTRFADLAVPVPTSGERGPEALSKKIADEISRWTAILGTNKTASQR